MNPQLIASTWFTSFESALASLDIPSVAACFLQEGWLRDLLVFSWDNRSLCGRQQISSYLANLLAPAKITDFALYTGPGNLASQACYIPQLEAHGVELTFTFECTNGHGRGHVRLLPDERGIHKAFTVMTELVDIRGHEELESLPSCDEDTGCYGLIEPQVQADYRRRRMDIESDPYVLIVGGGQTGLQVAARFQQMNIPALTIERDARVGDVWRKRYPALTLHTPKAFVSMLYQPFPSNWPQFIPRDKIADWLEAYATAQELLVWTGTELKTRPVWDPTSARWSVTVSRAGTPVALRPAHIVIATGRLGRAHTPPIPARDRFLGTTLHSQEYGGGQAYKGKAVLVVGAGNSAADIAQDLVAHGAGPVTMLQRSASCVTARDAVERVLRALYPDGAPLGECDFKATSMPHALLKRLAIASQERTWAAEREMSDALRRGGVRLTLGPEGQGLMLLVLEQGGGYWLDKGAAQLIGDGKILVQSGVSPASFTEHGLALSDGSEVQADAVIFATGYRRIHELNVELFGEDVMRKVGTVGGLDAEGELSGSYRPLGQPGLWFCTGDFAISRQMSKQLALHIKAIQLGIHGHPTYAQPTSTTPHGV